MELLQYIGTGLLLLGCFFILTGVIGLFRLPDVITRLHAAGVAEGLGAFLVLAGIGILSNSWAVAAKLVLLGIFLLITVPTACHALISAALKDSTLPKKPQRKDHA